MHNLTHSHTHTIYIFAHTMTHIYRIFYLSILQVICHDLMPPRTPLHGAFLQNNKKKSRRAEQTFLNSCNHEIGGFCVKDIHQTVEDLPGSSQTTRQFSTKITQNLPCYLNQQKSQTKGCIHISSTSSKKCFQKFSTIHMHGFQTIYMLCLQNLVFGMLFVMNLF